MTQRTDHERALARAGGDLSAEMPKAAGTRPRGCPPRTIALTIASLSAHVPALLFAPATSAVAPLRNAIAVVVIAALSAWWSIGEEERPDAEDSDGARAVKRFSPLAIGLVFAFITAFDTLASWAALKGLVATALVLGPFVHVPRVRAIHLLVSGVVLLAVVSLEPGAAPALLFFAAGAAAACAFDREDEAQERAGISSPLSLGLPLAMSLGTTAAGGALYALALALLPAQLPRRHTDLFSPRGGSREIVDPLAPKTGLPIGDLLLVLLGLAALLVVYHFIAEWRRGRLGAGKKAAETEPGLPLVTARPLGTDLDPDTAVAALPPGPRRDIVHRYLRHLERLRKQGVPRPDNVTPLELSRFVERRVVGPARDHLRALASLFGKARWSEEPVSDADAKRFADEANEVERSL